MNAPETILDAALFAARELGAYIFPVDHPDLPTCAGIRTSAHNPETCTKRGKHPCVKFSVASTATTRDITAMFNGTPRNYGIYTRQSCLLVLDVDDVIALERFLGERHRTLPDTFEVATGRGYHAYYRVPRDAGVGNGQLCPGVDVRAGSHGYVVGPGSRHASGATYEATWDRRPANAPTWLVDYLAAKARGSTGLTVVEGMPTVEDESIVEGESVGELPQWLRDRLAATSPTDRSTAFHGLVGACKDAGLTQGQTVTVMSSWKPGVGKYSHRLAEEVARCWNKIKDKAGAPKAAPTNEEDVFWTARSVLGHLHTFARARRVAPWAVLGVVLARVIAATKPFIQLPPTIGSYASLNLFIGLVGRPGDGKDAAIRVAKDAIEVGHFMTAPLGSGEGLSHMFMRETKEGLEQYNDAALVTVGEIDTMTALIRRQASTVAPQLRQAAMGEQLGFFYVDTAKRMIVPEHRYRLCLVVGIQPGRASTLLDDTDGGTPQRFVWLPAIDPGAPDNPPNCPTPLIWEQPPWQRIHAEHLSGQERVIMGVCSAATDTIIAAHLARTRGQGDALDGHALLTRTKVAAALAILEGRTAVADDDWQLSETVMYISGRTRANVIEHLQQANVTRNQQRAEAEASRTIVISDRVEDYAVQRVARVIIRRLGRETGQWITRTELSRAIGGRDRPHLDGALERLADAGQIDVEQTSRDQDGHGGTGRRYRITEGTR